MPSGPLMWFPGGAPNCSPAELRARILEKQRLFDEAQKNGVTRAAEVSPAEEWPAATVTPLEKQAPPKGRGVVIPKRLGFDLKKLANLDKDSLAAALDQVIDALYDNAIISNPDILAFAGNPRPLVITPGVPQMAANNSGSGRPLFVRLKGEVDQTNGTRTFLYAAPSSASNAVGSVKAAYDFGPVLEVILNGPGTVWVDGTAPQSQATFTVQVTTFYLNGRNTVYPGNR